MDKVLPVLRLGEIVTEREPGYSPHLAFNRGFITRWYVTLKMHLDCSFQGQMFNRVILISIGKHEDQTEAIRLAVQFLLNGKCDIKKELWAEGNSNVEFDKERFVTDFNGLEPDLKKLFEQLFTSNRWDIQKGLPV